MLQQAGVSLLGLLVPVRPHEPVENLPDRERKVKLVGNKN